MSLRSILAALVFGASAPVRAARTPRVTSTIIDARVSPERQAKLIEDGHKAVSNIISRTHVERTGHFDAPRFG